MCNCNKSIKTENKLIKAKTLIQKLWENSQLDQKKVIVKKINKS